MRYLFITLLLLSSILISAQKRIAQDSANGFKSSDPSLFHSEKEYQLKTEFEKRQYIKKKYGLGGFGVNFKIDSLNTSACTNIGFELGNLNGWSVSSGTNTNSSLMTGCCSTLGGAATATFVGADTLCYLSYSPFAGSRAARINDDIANKSVTRISYSYPVTSTNSLLEFAYMFMSQRSNHQCDSLPYMRIIVKDASNTIISNIYVTGPRITGTCSTSPTFFGCAYYPNLVSMFEWKRASVPLNALIGSTVTIDVTVGDCTKGDHYGYGYFDARCSAFDPLCTNIDFENGNLSGWIGTNGINGDSQKMNFAYITSGNTESSVLTGGTDPNKGFGLTSPLGGKVVRLNDFNMASINGSMNRISKTFSVTPANSTLQYSYMSILQDGSHVCMWQAFSDVSVYLQDGSLIHSNHIYATGSTGCTLTASGFSFTAPFYFSNWQTQTINLSAYTGSVVTLEFTAGDCTQMGHIGYSYFDAKCGIASGAEEVITKNNISVWPNPFEANLNVRFDTPQTKTATLLIYDAIGKIVFTKTDLSGFNSITLKDLNSGIYFYRVISENKSLNEGKIIKQ